MASSLFGSGSSSRSNPGKLIVDLLTNQGQQQTADTNAGLVSAAVAQYSAAREAMENLLRNSASAAVGVRGWMNLTVGAGTTFDLDVTDPGTLGNSLKYQLGRFAAVEEAKQVAEDGLVLAQLYESIAMPAEKRDALFRSFLGEYAGGGQSETLILVLFLQKQGIAVPAKFVFAPDQ